MQTWPFTAGETVLLITTVGGVLVSAISAIRVTGKQEVIKEKVAEVHDLTNSRLKGIEDRLLLSDSKLVDAVDKMHKEELIKAHSLQIAEREIYRKQIVTEMNEKAAAEKVALLKQIQPLLPIISIPTVSITENQSAQKAQSIQSAELDKTNEPRIIQP